MLERRRPARRVAAAAATALAILGAWLLLAPPNLGGQFRYAVVSGTSMEPLLHHGDLVLLRPHATYRVGEVVAYRNAHLGRVGLHRIVRRSGPYYIFKGDNNNFVDSDHPTGADLIGSLWLTVPVVGTVVGWSRTSVSKPVKTVRRISFIGLLAGLIFTLAAAATLKARRRAGGSTDELAEIRRLYRDRLVRITTPPLEPRGGYTDVSEMDALARLALDLDRPILEHSGSGQHTFYIEDRSTYRHRLDLEPWREAPRPAPRPRGLTIPVLADSGAVRGDGTARS